MKYIDDLKRLHSQMGGIIQELESLQVELKEDNIFDEIIRDYDWDNKVLEKELMKYKK